MSVLQVLLCKTRICGCLYRRHVPEKINLIFQELPNVFGIADDFIVVGYDSDGTDHDTALHRVLQIYRKENLTLNKNNACKDRNAST